MRRVSRWQSWVAVLCVTIAFWAQDAAAFAAARPTPSLGAALSAAAKWLHGGDGSGPHSTTGNASQVRRAADVAGHPAGSAPGRGKGQLNAYTRPRAGSNATGASAHARRGFDAHTSKRDAAKSGAQFDYFDNADGSFTRKVSQYRINYQDKSGNWQHIDTGLTQAADGRWQEKSNSLGVSFGASSGSASAAPHASASPSPSSTPASSATPAVKNAAYVVPAGTSALPWQLVRPAAATSAVSGSTSTGPLATLQISSSQSVSWSLQGASDVPAQVNGSTAEYDGILPDTNLQLQPTPDGVKETLVLASASAPTTWVFPMQLTGVKLATGSDGTVELQDSSGTVVARLPHAYAYDSYVDPVSGERHENWAVSYSLTQVNGTPAVQMSLDPNWLSGSSIKFPVTVDPSMTVSIAGQTQTTYVEYPYTGDFSSSGVLKVGTYDAGAHVAESLLKFPTLPTSNGYHIQTAQFAAFDIWASNCSVSDSYQVYPISSSWSVTGSKSWSDQPTVASSIGTWTGTPASSTCSNTSMSPTTGQWQYTALSTSYFQQIALGQVTNNGIAVAASNSDSNDWKQFDSSNVSSNSPYLYLTYAPNVAPDIEHTYPATGYTSSTLTPELQVQAVDPDTWPNSSMTYDFAVYNSSGTQVATSGYQSSTDWTVPAGKLAWSSNYTWAVSAYDGWSTTTSNGAAFTTLVAQPLVSSRLAQNSGHGYDDVAGNYTTHATDAQVATVGPELKVNRAYNSQDTRTTGAFGAGWSSLADMKAVMDDDGSQNVVLTDASGKQQRYGYASTGYTPPLGTYATLVAISGGGYTLTDKAGTTYTFGAAGGTNTWLLSKITTHEGLAETLSYNASYQLTQIQNSVSQRALHFTWATPSGAAHAHVATVTTDDATAGNASTASLWTYSYTGDQLTGVCPPSENAPSTAATSCYAYSYTAGSNYPAAALDAGPTSYWRLNDASGSTRAASGVLGNEQNDAGTYANVTLGTDASPLAGSTAKAAQFNGTSSDVALPSGLVSTASNQAVSLWFKTSTAGILFSYQADPMGQASTNNNYTPSLYVGTDGKLHGEFWYSGNVNAIVSSGSVFGGWHHVVISAAGTSQTMYLDGTAVGSVSGQVQLYAANGSNHVYLGAGYWGGGWQDEPKYNTGSNTGYPDYFSGDIADVSFYSHPLTATQAANLHTIGASSAAYLTGITTPAGRTQAQVSYDTAASRLTSVTDENGGTYTLGTPTVTGSSAVYHSAVLGANPMSYWQLGDLPGSSYAANEVNGDNATYNNVTLGTAGPFASKDSTAATAATFDGSTSYVQLPSQYAVTTGPNTVALWFKTTTAGGTLYGQEGDPITNATGNGYVPSLYVGTDGKLHAEFWINNIPKEMASGSAVNDGKWHYVVLAASTSSQTLYLDGASQATVAATLSAGATGYTYIGAGACAGSWAYCESNSAGYFTGSIADVAFYGSQLSATQVGQQWSAYQQSNGTVATETVSVTDPGNKTLSSSYDLSNQARILSSTDGTGGTTYYGYDAGGFLYTVTDPNGNVTTTGHDARGNVVSKTTCQDRSANKCETSYYTYYLNTSSPTDPRNDEMLTSADGRSASSSDTTYRTSYTYDPNGNELTKTSPAVPGASSGLTQTNTFTTSSTAGYASGTTAPAGLPATEKTPAGAQTSYTYYANGDLAQEVSPLGQKTLYTYDQLGRVASKQVISDTYPSGLTTSYSYDPFDRVLTQTDPGVTDAVDSTVHTQQTSYTYDVDGNKLTTTVADTSGGNTTRATSKAYNSHGQVQTATDPMGYQTQYTYDAYGNVATKTMPRGQQYAYTYDANGHLLTTTLSNYTGSTSTSATAAAQLLETRTYDAGGRPSTITDAIGDTKSFAYYDDNLTKQVTETGSANSTYIDEQDSYDAAGNLTSQVTRNGTLTTQHTYDAANRVQSTTVDPTAANRVTSYTYDGDDHVLTSTQTDAAADPQQQWTYTYDAAGDKLSAAQYATSTSTLTTSWAYDQRGLPKQKTDPLGKITTYGYNQAGQLSSTVAPTITTTSGSDGTTSSVAPTTLAGYDTFGELVQSEDARGDITTTAYDADGRKTASTLPAYTPHGSATAILATTTWTYDQDGNLTKQVDANNNETDYAYDQLNDQVSKTNPAISINGTSTQGTWTYSYNLANQPLTATDPYGSVSHTDYDDLGRTKDTWRYLYLSSGATSTTQTQTNDSYNTAGELASQTSLTGVTTAYGYDNLGQKTSQSDTTGDTTHYSYDLLGDITKTTAPDNTAHTTSYDSAGRKTGTADQNASGTVLRSTSATYDADGNQLTSTDALGTTKTYAYDAIGDLTTQTEPTTSSHSITTSFGYDAAGNQTASTDGNGQTTYFTYTPWNTKESKEVPAASSTLYTGASDRTTWLTYDANGNPVSTTLPGGVTVTGTYDALNNLTGQSGTGADAATAARSFTYDLLGQLTSATAGSNSETFTHNSAGNLLSTGGAVGGTSSFTYNQDLAPTARTDAAGTSSYTYDTNGRLHADTDAATGTTLTYGYNSLSQPTTVSYGTSADTQTLGYDTLHRLTSDTLTTSGGATVASISYAYDNGDHLTTKTTSGFTGASSNTYGYDQAGRLTSWTNTPSGGTATTTGYTYDDAGNRLTAGNTTYHYDNRDELTADGTSTHSYTARGTLTGRTVTATNTTTAYSFDAYGQQATAGSTSYTYDGLGRTVTVGSASLTYSGQGNDVASDGTTTYSRGPSGQLTGENTTGSGATLTLTDVHTDLVGQFTATGTTLTGSAAYDPWGTVTSTTGMTGGIGYQSEYTDPTTGQVNMLARWYTPGTGSFDSADTFTNSPIGNSTEANLFAYADDNPLTDTDPSGHRPLGPTDGGTSADNVWAAQRGMNAGYTVNNGHYTWYQHPKPDRASQIRYHHYIADPTHYMVDYSAATYRAYVVAERQAYQRAVAYERAQAQLAYARALAQLAYDRAQTHLHQAPTQFNASACGRFGQCAGQPRQLQGSIPKPLKVVGLGLGAIFLTGADLAQGGADPVTDGADIADIEALDAALGDGASGTAASDASAVANDNNASVDWQSEFEGLTKGRQPHVRESSSADDMRGLFDRWTAGADRMPARGAKIPDVFKLSDGTVMQWRLSSASGGETIDIFPELGKALKVHLP